MHEAQKKFHEIKELSYASVTIVLMITSLFALTFLFLPKMLSSLYLNINDPQNVATLHLTILIFSILAFSQILDGLRNTFIGILRGMFDTRFPMYASLISIWLIGMPLSYLLGFTWHQGAVGFVIGGLIGMLSGAIIMFYRWQVLNKRYANGLQQ